MNFFDKLVFLVGLALCCLGTLGLIGSLGNLVDPGEASAWTYVLATLFLGIIPSALGLWVCRHARRKGKRRSHESTERTILELARERSGKLTVADVAMNTSLSSSEAKEALDQLNLDRLADMDVSESGVVVYHFHGVDGDNR